MSIQQVFYANSTYSLVCYLLNKSNQQASSVSEVVDQTLFVVGKALADIQVPAQNKILIEEKDNAKSINAKVSEKVGNQELPWYINARGQDAEAMIKQTSNVFIVTDGLSDHDTFPALVRFPNVKKCYSTRDIVGDLKSEKIDEFSVKDLWNKSRQEDRNLIADVFNVSKDDLNKASSRPVLLITQPLSEDQMMDEKDKVELYRRIVKKYGQENIILKPHPREKTDWKKEFPDMPIIPRQIPMELLAKMTDLTRVATFFSTAAFGTLSDDKVDFYAADFKDLRYFHPDVLDEKGHRSVAVSDVEATYRPTQKCNWLRIPDDDGRFYKLQEGAQKIISCVQKPYVSECTLQRE